MHGTVVFVVFFLILYPTIIMICLIIQKTALLRRCDIHFPWKVGIKTGAEQSGKPPEN